MKKKCKVSSNAQQTEGAFHNSRPAFVDASVKKFDVLRRRTYGQLHSIVPYSTVKLLPERDDELEPEEPLREIFDVVGSPGMACEE